jgi:hypothetical protein
MDFVHTDRGRDGCEPIATRTVNKARPVFRHTTSAMEVSQHSTHRLDYLPLCVAAYATTERQHERVHDRDSQAREISTRKVLGEMMQKPLAPPPMKIERCLAQSPMMLKKREVFLQEVLETILSRVP